MKRVLLIWFVFLVGGKTLSATTSPSIVGISTPYPLLQSSVQFGGVAYGTGIVAYAPVGTPIVISGANFGSNGTVEFQGPHKTTTVTVSYSNSNGASIALLIPTGATTGTLVVVGSSGISNAVPIVITNGTYGASCSTTLNNKLTPTLAWAQPAAITYGTALGSSQLNASSGGIAGTVTYTPIAGSIVPTGTQTLSATFTPADTTDYNTVSGSVTLQADKAELTVTANNVSMIKNRAVPALTYTATGFMGSDTASVLSGTPSLSTTATASSALGTYPITIASGTLSAANYWLNYVNGTITVAALLEPGIINTAAGDGTSAVLDPWGVAVDTAGNIYIADSAHNRISMVAVSTGAISTLAGNGTGGYSGDGGLAINAELYRPQGVAVDAKGTLYIADYGNNRIRKVTGGSISTVAGNGTQGYSGNGGSATSAKLSSPDGIAVDAAGNLFIADSGNSCVRKVTASTGKISTVAGNGTAGYSGDGGLATSAELEPEGVAVDSSGNLYIADFDSRIRKVTTAGYISTVAGNGTFGNSGDNGLATNAELGYLYSVAVDSSGNLFIADYANNRVREVTASTGYISTVAGNGTEGYSGDFGLATSAELSYPLGVAVDISGNIYIADSNNDRIRVVGGNLITPTVSLSASQPSAPYGAPVTFTASVPTAATGTMTFFDGGMLGTAPVPVSNGTATYTTTALAAGSNIITASYSGDTNYNPSTSVSVTVPVTEVTLAASTTSTSYGTPVTFTATVPTLATGTVVFLDNGKTLGSGTVSGNTATFTTSLLSVGSHPITAAYSGDNVYCAATSGSLAQAVMPSPQEITTKSLANGIQNWSYTATLQATGGTAPYSWSVSSGSLPAGLTLNSASGTISGTSTGSGTSAFTVLVTDAALNSVSAPLSIVINPAEASSRLVSLSPSSGPPGAIITASGSNFGNTQTESSSVSLNGSAVSVLQWSNSAIVFAVPSGSSPGSMTVRVNVAGDSNTLTFTVQGATACTVN